MVHWGICCPCCCASTHRCEEQRGASNDSCLSKVSCCCGHCGLHILDHAAHHLLAQVPAQDKGEV